MQCEKGISSRSLTREKHHGQSPKPTNALLLLVLSHSLFVHFRSLDHTFQLSTAMIILVEVSVHYLKNNKPQNQSIIFAHTCTNRKI